MIDKGLVYGIYHKSLSIGALLRARVGTIYYFTHIYNYEYRAKPANKGALRWKTERLCFIRAAIGGEKGLNKNGGAARGSVDVAQQRELKEYDSPPVRKEKAELKGSGIKA